MKDNKLKASITLSCPNGHRLRGDKRFLGKTVSCPKCKSMFTIGASTGKKSVSDTTIMRILGDVPKSDLSAPAQPTVNTRACPRCGVATAEDAPVCEHCNTYVGAMPRFMTDITNDRRIGLG